MASFWSRKLRGQRTRGQLCVVDLPVMTQARDLHLDGLRAVNSLAGALAGDLLQVVGNKPNEESQQPARSRRGGGATRACTRSKRVGRRRGGQEQVASRDQHRHECVTSLALAVSVPADGRPASTSKPRRPPPRRLCGQGRLAETGPVPPEAPPLHVRDSRGTTLHPAVFEPKSTTRTVGKTRSSRVRS